METLNDWTWALAWFLRNSSALVFLMSCDSQEDSKEDAYKKISNLSNCNTFRKPTSLELKPSHITFRDDTESLKCTTGWFGDL